MKLLRVLQSGEFERVGSSTTRKVDVRIISATNADLRRAIAAGSFREDLCFRLNVIALELPPLAERSEDILPLAERYLTTLNEELRLSDDARAKLLEYDWPGNVRELHNRLQRASLVCSGTMIGSVDLGLVAGSARPAAAPEPAPASDGGERAQVQKALARAQGVVSKAAVELGLSRQALYRRMERLGLSISKRVE